MSDDKNKFKLLEQIMSIDFMIVDLNLYLNTHPMDKEAIANTIPLQCNQRC